MTRMLALMKVYHENSLLLKNFENLKIHSRLMVFQTNPCKCRNFQTVVKHFIKHYGAQISF